MLLIISSSTSVSTSCSPFFFGVIIKNERKNSIDFQHETFHSIVLIITFASRTHLKTLNGNSLLGEEGVLTKRKTELYDNKDGQTIRKRTSVQNQNVFRRTAKNS